jgi:hypothetical protein
MPKLFVFDGSEVNRDKDKCFNYQNHPTISGFKNSLRNMDLPIPFLVRGLFGDWEYKDGERFVKPTFGKLLLDKLLSVVLKNGNDKYNPNGKRIHPEEERLSSKKGIDCSSFIWANEYINIEDAGPYRFYDDMSEHPQGRINDLSMILDSNLYTASDRDRILFYQSDIKERVKALKGIILCDTNPNRKTLNPLEFELNIENINKVVREIKKNGYFI